jgi:hypothetical protein
MWNSLRLRIFLMIALVGVAAVGTAAVFASQGTQSAVTDFVRADAARDQRLVGAAMEGAVMFDDPVLIERRAQELQQLVGADVLLVDASGTVLLDSAQQQVGENIVWQPPVLVASNDWPATIEYLNQPAFVVLRYEPVATSPGTRWIAGTPAEVMWSAPRKPWSVISTVRSGWRSRRAAGWPWC